MNVVKIIHAFHRAARNKVGTWGEADCLHYAADIAQAITGRDPIEHIRGRYDSELGSKRVMVDEGWETLGDVARSCFEEIPVAQARSGDWALVLNDNGVETIGVICGTMITAQTETGTGLVPLSAAREAYRVE